MQIGCTKKLLDEFSITPNAVEEEQDIFCWSAHLITVKRRKTLVIVNDATRFGFVIHGLKAKDFPKLKEYIIEGIRNSLTELKVKEELINKYIGGSGEVVFAKTRGRSYVGRLNKACEFAEAFEDRFDDRHIYQQSVTDIINHDLVKIGKYTDYEYCHDLMEKNLGDLFGEQAISCKAVDLLLKLNLGVYTAIRRIVVPEDISFRKLHKIIQVVFNWKDYHLYEFSIFDRDGKCVMNLISEYEEIDIPREDRKVLLDNEIKLSTFMDGSYKIMYRYDYGDNWNHEIILQGHMENYDKSYPRCVLGDGNAPPEDVGGITGYERFLEVMADTTHPEHKETKMWAEGMWYRDFDIDLVNRRLRYALFHR
jgi:hypothetical protein